MAELTKAMWEKLKREYITTDISLRGLAQKYGVSSTSCQKKCREDGWVKAREDYYADITRKSLDRMAAHEAKRTADVVDRIADKLLAKIERSVDELEIFQVEKQEEHKEYTYNESGDKVAENRILKKTVEACNRKMIDRQGLKAITSALKDLKEIKMLQTALQEAEQQARIDKLRKECETEDKQKTVVVTFEDGDAYGV